MTAYPVTPLDSLPLLLNRKPYCSQASPEDGSALAESGTRLVDPAEPVLALAGVGA